MIVIAPRTVEPGTEKLMIKRKCHHCEKEHVFLGVPAHGQACPLCNRGGVGACDFCAKSSKNGATCPGGCFPELGSSQFVAHPKFLLPSVEEPGLEES